MTPIRFRRSSRGRDPRVDEAGGRYLAEHGQFAFSAITYYEILRGFRANRVSRTVDHFLDLANRGEIVPVTIAVLERAADLWVDARRGGHPRIDADLIIAATALGTRRVLATGNTAHFDWIRGLTLADWRSGSQRP